MQLKAKMYIMLEREEGDCHSITVRCDVRNAAGGLPRQQRYIRWVGCSVWVCFGYVVSGTNCLGTFSMTEEEYERE